MDNKKEEPKTAPESERWYNLKLGSSYEDCSSKRYCTLRYEFKPASIDKKKKGSLRKNKENRVSVEFNNNQVGKPKVAFEGSNEEHKENDAVLFFDGETFRLERLHRAVNQLRLLRSPGESAPAASAAAGASLTYAPAETRSSPVGKFSKSVPLSMSAIPPTSVEVERIDVGEPVSSGSKFVPKESSDHTVDVPNVSLDSSGPKNEVDEHRDIDMEDLFGIGTPEDEDAEDKDNAGFDINISRNYTDDEIADVDDSGDEVDKGPNAAEALRAQVNAEAKARAKQTSSSSTSSGSGGGDGISSSSSSDDSDDDDSVNSI